MADAPSAVVQRQLDDLHIALGQGVGTRQSS